MKLKMRIYNFEVCRIIKNKVRVDNASQQSVHPTLGILARFQAFFYASAFLQSDGVPPPAPARVTQTVRPLPCVSLNLSNSKPS
jgi:hypothetical protein